jgi:opacity protein-like surface antigen
MKKLVSVLLLTFLFTGFINAQRNMSIGAGFVVSLPMGDFGDAANTGFGGTAAFEMEFMPQLIGVGQVGYITWGTDVDEVSFSAIPILVGVKYFFVPGVGFYGIGQLGLTIFSADTPEFVTPFGTFGGSESSTEFTFGIGAGYEVPVSSTVSLDFTGGFNLISDANNIQFRAGAKFDL